METRRSAVHRKLKTFYENSILFMPLLPQHFCLDIDSDEPENVTLYLPSTIPESLRNLLCPPALVNAESAIREAQVCQALNDLRRELRARMFANKFKMKHVTGVRYMTCARDWMKRIDEKVVTAKHEYQHARASFLSLRGPGSWEDSLRELKDEDVRGINERALSAQEVMERKAAREAAGSEDDELTAKPMSEGCQPGERNRQPISWIWYTFSTGRKDGEDEESPEMHEGTSFPLRGRYFTLNSSNMFPL